MKAESLYKYGSRAKILVKQDAQGHVPGFVSSLESFR